MGDIIFSREMEIFGSFQLKKGAKKGRFSREMEIFGNFRGLRGMVSDFFANFVRIYLLSASG